MPALLLDTHVWLWLEAGERNRFSSAVYRQLENCHSTGLHIGAISIWEVAMLDAKGRILLSEPCDRWIRAALRRPSRILQALTPEVAIEATRLPGLFHSDPADRIIVATARIQGLRLVTADSKILHYAESGHVDAIRP